MNSAAQAALSRGYDLHCQGRLPEAEQYYQEAIGLDPETKEAWINLGLVQLANRRLDEAIESQRHALRIDPDSADAHNNLGMAHYAKGNIAEAENAFRAAVRLRPDLGNAVLNLGSVRQLANHVEDAEGCFRRAIALGADKAHANSNLALALMEQGRPAEAEARCREALAASPDYPEARANRALALLMMGRWEEGWREYESRWAVEAMCQPAPALTQPRWTGQPLNGETVLLYAEQGFGDVLQFCRYAPLVAEAGGRVILVVPNALRRVMQTLEGVQTVLGEDDVIPGHDYQCPLMSLPFAFNTTLETIPAPLAYLSADAGPWAEFLAGLPGLKIGLVWAGKSRAEQPHAMAIDKRRSMRLYDMAPLLSVPGCSFISLQLGPPARQLSMLEAGKAIDVSGRLTDWYDTACLMTGLDLVITVDTAVAHLAGALGRKVWMLNRFDSCWRWLLEGETTGWYPTMRIFRQVRRGDWAEVVARVRAELEREALRRG